MWDIYGTYRHSVTGEHLMAFVMVTHSRLGTCTFSSFLKLKNLGKQYVTTVCRIFPSFNVSPCIMQITYLCMYYVFVMGAHALTHARSLTHTHTQTNALFFFYKGEASAYQGLLEELVRRIIKVVQAWHEGIAGFFFHANAS